MNKHNSLMHTLAGTLAICLISGCTKASDTVIVKATTDADLVVALPDNGKIEMQKITDEIFIGKFEVSKAQWEAVMGSSDSSDDPADYPIRNISMHDVEIFLDKLNDYPESKSGKRLFRLPTAEEWALTVATPQQQSSTNDVSKGWFAENSDGSVHKVGTAANNDGKFRDTRGNVWEMTSTRPSANENIYLCRGGSYKHSASRCFSGFELWYTAKDKCEDIGFRVVLQILTDEELRAEEKRRSEKLKEAQRNQLDIDIKLCELNLKWASDNDSRKQANARLTILKALQNKLNGQSVKYSPGDIVPVCEFEKCTLMYDGTTYSFVAKGEFSGISSDMSMYGKQVYSTITIGGEHELNVLFKAISKASTEMFNGVKLTMDTKFPEAQKVEWAVKDDRGNTLSYGRKVDYQLLGACTGYSMTGADTLIIGTDNFKAKEDGTRCGAAFSLTRLEAFDIKQGQTTTVNFIAEYNRLTQETNTGDTNSQQPGTVADVNAATPIVDKLIADMVKIPGKNFSLCKYEVTQALWTAIMGDNPSEFTGNKHPVENVSWYDCQNFIIRLNSMPNVKAAKITFRLPTQQEWEFACRAGSTGSLGNLSDGTEGTQEQMAWVRDYTDKDPMTRGTHEVGLKQPNAFGLYDMHGNVCEWTSSTIPGLGDMYRIYKGGSWIDSRVSCSQNEDMAPSYKMFDLGLRLAY